MRLIWKPRPRRPDVLQRIETEAIVLRVTDVGESDRIVQLLTPEWGRLSAMAKNARKSVRRFPGTLDLLNHLRVGLSRRPGSLSYLSRGVLLSPLLGLRADPGRFAMGCYLAELLSRVAPEGNAEGEARALFDFTLRALETIERRTPDTKLHIFLELQALSALGMRPELRNCVRCARELQRGQRLGFHVADGGAVCPRCRRSTEELLPVHLGTLRALERGLVFGLEDLDRIVMRPAEISEADRIVTRFHRFHLGLELRSEEFLRAFSATASRAGVARRAPEGNTSAPQSKRSW